MKLEKMMARKAYSEKTSLVWTAKSEAYWKNELDDRLAVFEKQRQKYEEQVNILEEQLPRFIPDFGKHILPRDTKKKTRKGMDKMLPTSPGPGTSVLSIRG